MGFPKRSQSFTITLLLVSLGCGATPDAGGDASSATSAAGSLSYQELPTGFARVRSGFELLLSDSLHLVRGKRVGLITNQTGVDAQGTSIVDVLHARDDLELVALFGPEHGIRGVTAPGERIDDGRDDRTGLPVFSLYGATLRPTPEVLEGLDVLLIDYQEVGARYWTYASTMTLAMEAAGEAGVPVVVLDRPNPIGGAIGGNMLEAAFGTFVGRFPIAMRHGMTPGELARYYEGEFGIGVDLTVVPIEGWTHDMPFAETGLPWIAPSPNIPSVASALHYPGTCLFEGTNLSVARGTELPFQQIGAPWLDGQALAEAMSGYALADVTFEAVTFTPENPGDGKYDGESVRGVRLTSIGPDYDPTRTAVALLVESRRLAGERWEWLQTHFDRLAGTDQLRLGIEAGHSFGELTGDWAPALETFAEVRDRYLIYP